MPVRVQSCTISEEYSERFIDKCIENGTILKAVQVANETQMKKAYLIKYHTFTAFTAKQTNKTVLLGAQTENHWTQSILDVKFSSQTNCFCVSRVHKLHFKLSFMHRHTLVRAQACTHTHTMHIAYLNAAPYDDLHM